MKLLVLETGLYENPGPLLESLAVLQSGHEVERLDLVSAGLDEAGWDQVVHKLLAADRVLTV